MATAQPQTTDAPTLPTNTHPWPAFDRSHDPVYLVTNDPTPTEGTTLADFGGNSPADPETVLLVAPSPLETTKLNLESAVAVGHYRADTRPDEIADATDTNLETVARALRRAGVLAPYDDPRALAHLYHEDGHTLESLADVFGNARGPESIRARMEHFGISRGETHAQKLAALNPEDVGLSPMHGDDGRNEDYGQDGRA